MTLKFEIDYYSKILPSYDKLHKEEQFNKLRIIKHNLKLNGLILDIGSGTGFSTKFFNNVIQLDPVLEMLKKSSGLRVCAQAEHLPFKDNTFDGIIAVTSLHHTDINRAISEIKRVSKPNAKYAFSLLRSSSKLNTTKDSLKKNFNLKGIIEKKDLILLSI